nr:glycosyltransferase [Halomonas daqiaonensis]
MSSARMMNALICRGHDVTLVTFNRGERGAFAILDDRVRCLALRPCLYSGISGNSTGPRSTLRRRALRQCLRVVCILAGFPSLLRLLLDRFDAAGVLVMGYPRLIIEYLVRADTKMRWIRSDLSGADPTGSVARSLRRATTNTDLFICVSKVARASFLAAVPEAADKAVVIYNILNSDEMHARAKEAKPPFPPPQDGVPVVLSVCRLSEHAKGLTRMVRVCRALAEAEVSFHWYVAGEGPDRPLLEHEIDRHGMSARMILLGRLDNPFPAYRAADLVAMLSHYEGLCGVVNEARVLGKPVIATQVSGIDEQLEDGVNGVVVEQDENAIVAAMARLLTDTELRARLADGGYPAALLDDAAKLDHLEALVCRRKVAP